MLLQGMAQRMLFVHECGGAAVAEAQDRPAVHASYSSALACACSCVVYTLASSELCARAATRTEDEMLKTDELICLTSLVRAVRALVDSATGPAADWR